MKAVTRKVFSLVMGKRRIVREEPYESYKKTGKQMKKRKKEKKTTWKIPKMILSRVS